MISRASSKAGTPPAAENPLIGLIEDMYEKYSGIFSIPEQQCSTPQDKVSTTNKLDIIPQELSFW